MATIARFEDLKSWQKARQLSLHIYELTRNRNFYADPDLTRQIRRASGSVMDNIAEGYGRGGRLEFVQFLGIAKGSLTEVKSQLYRSLDNEYVSQQEFETLYQEADETGKLIDGMIVYLNKTDVKGRKYQQAPTN